MLEEIRGLLILQDRDKRLMTLAKESEKLPQDEARARTRLASDEAALKKAKDELNTAELSVKKIAMDVETRKNTIKRLQTQQFETKKNDEYNALGHEVKRYEKEVDELETKELEAMEEVDAFRVKYSQAETRLALTQKLVEEDLSGIRDRHIQMEQQVIELRADRDKLVQAVSEDILPLYEKLMKSKDGKAIANLHGGKCTGCNMKVITSTAIAVQSEKEITQCENCGRLLAMDE